MDKVRVTGSVADRPKSGRPFIYNEREDRALVRASLQDPLKSTRDIVDDREINHKRAYRGTINTILKTHKVTSRLLPRRMSDLTSDHLKERLMFAKEHLHWDFYDWSLVVFCDESDLLPTKCGSEYVRMKEGQKLVDIAPLRQTPKRDVTIKVWGAVSSLGIGPLVRYQDTMNALKYRDTLEETLFQEYPMIELSRIEEEGPQDQWPTFSFAQDNASSHTSKKVQGWLDENAVNCLTLPPDSSDINIIENLWAYVQSELFEIKDHIHSPDDTWERV